MSSAPVTLLVDGQDVTARADNISWSNSDPGGCEAAGFTLADPARKGARVTVLLGTEPAWEGRVDGPDRDLAHGRFTNGLSCVGDRAKLTDKVLAMVYVDRDLTRWSQVPASRRLLLLQSASTYEPHEDTITEPAADGTPALLHQITGAWGAVRPVTETWYDAGPAAKLSAIFWQTQDADSTVNTGDANWVASLAFEDPVGTAAGSSAALVPAAGSTLTGSLTASPRARWAYLNLLYNSGLAAGVEGKVYTLRVRPVAVGTHGLALSGSSVSTYSLRCDEIAVDAAQRAGLRVAVAERAAANLQAAYHDEVPIESIVEEQASAAGGWHWGVWPARGLNAQGSEFWFCRPSSVASVVIDAADIDTGSFAERSAGAYTSAHVTYTDGAGTPQVVTVNRDSAVLAGSGVSRVLQVDAGVATIAGAQTLGLFSLALADIGGRAAGQLQLPGEVQVPGGGRKPAALLRAGIDRARLVGLPSPSGLTDEPADLTFRIARVSSAVDGSGRVTTTAELDAGADLQEVLNARLATAAG